VVKHLPVVVKEGGSVENSAIAVNTMNDLSLTVNGKWPTSANFLVKDSPVIVKEGGFVDNSAIDFNAINDSSLAVNRERPLSADRGNAMKRAKLVTKYSDNGCTTSLSSVKRGMILGQRIIARSRVWSSEVGE
jgi:hypothetical protein